MNKAVMISIHPKWCELIAKLGVSLFLTKAEAEAELAKIRREKQ